MASPFLANFDGMDEDEQAQLLVAKFAKALLATMHNMESQNQQPSLTASTFPAQEPIHTPVIVLPEHIPQSQADTENTSEAEEVEKPDEVKSMDEDGEEEPADPKYEPAGTISECINLYEGRVDWRGRTVWTREYPTDIEDPPENAESEQYALLLRNKKCYDGRKALEIDSLVIQSPSLKVLLGKVFEGYTGLNTEVDRLEFTPPFKPFVHRWEEFCEAREEEKDEITKKHADLLWKVLNEELKDSIREKNDNVSLGVVQFKNIWTIFEPSTMLYGKDDDGNDRLYRLKEGELRNSQTGVYFCLDCEYVDWDGVRFGMAQQTLPVFPFTGTRDIQKLPVFPINFHPNKDAIMKKCLERGRIFESFNGYHFKFYEGPALEETMWGKARRNINTRVIIDSHAYYSFNPNRKQAMHRLHAEATGSTNSNELNYDYNNNFDDEGDSGPANLTEDHLMMCTNVLRGYALKDKKWLEMYIPYVSEITFNKDAFDSLVAPPAEKQLVLAFTRSQRKNKDIFDDYIDKKGKGIVMLLSGPPGVGKTLTAESVAEALQVPLYSISSGDLGTTAHELESALGRIMEMTTRWSACLLLDEADVYLEARTKADLDRNAIVSIFLRILEYYQGILFLTTNLVENMDQAFESRIHMTLEYKELDTKARHQVWANFIDRCKDKEEFTTEQLDALADVKLNGRQIKNLMKSAQLLSSDQEKPLAFAHIKAVLDVRNKNIRFGTA